MSVYIEYVLLENFLYDGTFLGLALYAGKEKLRWKRLLFSALIGAVYALAQPFLRLPILLNVLLKIAVGCLLCMLAFGRIKGKESWRRYALCCFFFFLFSFSFGGALLAFARNFGEEKIPSGVVFFGVSGLALVSIFAVKKLYARKKLYTYIYTCEVRAMGNSIEVKGFFDSGNRAMKNGLPVCFLSPDVLYDVFLSNEAKEGGQVRDEMEIKTMSGVKKVPLYLGNLCVYDGQKNTETAVYFAPSMNMIGREYKILISARILEG